jgi:hypothetical protein
MTERRVSVRLVAVGGSQVKAELVQIGQTGEAALGGLVPAANRAAAAMSRVERMGASAWNQSYRTQQMVFQLNDVFVSLASGMSPLTVAMQQGTQIAQIYGGQGGLASIMRDLGGIVRTVVTRFGPLAAVLGVIGLGFRDLRDSIRASSGVAVTWGDTVLATFQVIGGGLYSLMKPAVDLIAPWFSAAWNLVIEGTVTAMNAVIKGARIGIDYIGTIISNVPHFFAAAWAGAKEIVFGALYQMGLRLETFLNAAVEGFNSVFRTELPMVILDGVSSLEVDRFFAARDRAAAEAAGLANMDAFRDRAAGIMASDPMGEFFGAVSDQAVENALNRTAEAAGRAGSAGRQAGRDTAEGAETALSGWERVRSSLSEYARETMDLAGGIGDALVGAFRGGEEAIAQFVKTGKLDFRDLVTTMIADLARLASRRFILGPLANLLGSALGSIGGGIMAPVLHQGGMVGESGPLRSVPALAFAQAPRLHGGGWIGPDEVPAILQRGERVLSRREAKGWGAAPVTVTIMARDVESFRASRAQIGSDIARAVAAGRRGM